jgi:hypothetical protein
MADLPPAPNNSRLQEKRRSLPWRSLTWQLLFLTVLPLTVLVLVIAFGSLTVHQNAMRTLVGERDERAVRTAAAALEEQASHRVIAIRGLSLLAEGASPEKLAAILASSDYLLPEFDAGLAFFSPDGALESAVGDPDLWENWISQITPAIHDLLANNAPPTYLSSAFSHPVSGEPLVLVLAVSPAGDWIAAGAFSAADMVQHTLTSAFASSHQASVIVIDAEKHLLYQVGSFSSAAKLATSGGQRGAARETGTTYVR